MTTAYTSLLGLALPVTGELSGTWGDVVNTSITSLLDSAIAGTTTLSSDVDVTLTTTQGVANTSREAIILWTAGGTATRTITVPAQSKIYTVINKTSSTQSIKIVGAGPTTGVTIIAGEATQIAWNGVDFVKVGEYGGDVSFRNVTVSSLTDSGLTSGRVTYATTAGLLTDSANLTFNGTTLTANTLNLTNQLTTAYGGTGLTSYTAGDLPYYATGTALSKLGIGTSGQILTSSGTAPQWSTLSGVAVTTFSAGTTGFTPSSATSGAVTLAGTLATTNGGTGLTSFTANGVVYASSTSALATGSALTFDGTNLGAPRILQSGSGTYGAFNSSGAGNAWASYQYASSEIGEIGQGSGIISGGSNTDFGIRATNNLVFGISYTEQMRLTSTGLGIGTSSPAQKLDVGGGTGTPAIRINGGSSTNTGPYLQFARGGTQTNIIGPYSSVASGTANDLTYYSTSGYGHIWFSNGQASNINMQLDSSGNLGLGVTPSAWGFGGVLEVGSYGTSFASVNGTDISFSAYYNAGWKYQNSSYAPTLYTQASGQHRWLTAPSGTAGNAISFTQAMTLDASGNLGVGTTSPVDKLQVEGNIYLGTTGRTIYQAGSADLTLQVNTGNIKFFRANGVSESARIDSSGNLLVGTSAFANSNTNSAILQASGGTCAFIIQHDTGNVSGNAYEVFNYNGSAIGSITQSGTTAVLYNVTSDQRLKENIQDAAPASALIDSLQVRKYDWKSDGSHQRYGFVAQELVTVAPEAVHQPADPEEMMAVDYSKLVPMLVKEIQSLRKRLADAGI